MSERMPFNSCLRWWIVFCLGSLLVAGCGEANVKEKGGIVVSTDAGMQSDDSGMQSSDAGMQTGDTDPDCCSGRQCGVDPACAQECGSCSVEQTCSESGTCVEPDPSAPRILDFSSNVTTITPSQSARISIVATDPDGIDDLIGGSLKLPGGASFGSFQTASSEGAYEIDITWQDVITIQDVQFGISGGTLTIVAEFFDQAGNVARESKVLSLTCNDPQNEAACEVDTCINVMANDDHCGQCDSPVTLNDGVCRDGMEVCGGGLDFCADQQACRYLGGPENCGSCGNDCSDVLAMNAGPNTSVDSPSVDCDNGGTLCSGDIVSTELQSCDSACGSGRCLWTNFVLYTNSDGGTYRDDTFPPACDERPSSFVNTGGFDYQFDSVECHCEV